MDEKAGLSPDVYIRRVQKTQERMVEENLDGLVAVSSFQEREGHVIYLTNHHISFPNAMTHLGLGFAAVVLSQEGEAVLAAPLGYEKGKVVGVEKAYDNPNLVADIVSAIKHKKLEGRRLGIAGMDTLPASYYQQLVKALPKNTFSEADALLEIQRANKTPEEIQLLQDAARVADRALQAGLEAIHPGVGQLAVEAAARRAAMQAGADFVGLIRVSSGRSVSILQWPIATQQPIQKGDFVFLDVIGWRQQYGFDVSRVTVAGGPTPEQSNYLNHLVEATDWMVQQMQPHRPLWFNLTGSRGRTIVPMAHGIGLEICETPWVALEKEIRLSPGMVICVGPSVQDEAFGSMAIKEMMVITDSGSETLTHMPKKTW